VRMSSRALTRISLTACSSSSCSATNHWRKLSVVKSFSSRAFLTRAWIWREFCFSWLKAVSQASTGFLKSDFWASRAWMRLPFARRLMIWSKILRPWVRSSSLCFRHHAALPGSSQSLNQRDIARYMLEAFSSLLAYNELSFKVKHQEFCSLSKKKFKIIRT